LAVANVGCDSGKSSVPPAAGGAGGVAGAAAAGAGGAGGGAAATGGNAGGGGKAAYAPTPGGYKVQGNKIVDGSGATYHFHGVSRPSLEWYPGGEVITVRDWQLMKEWGANVVRLPLNQVFWRNDTNYRDFVGIYVNEIKSYGMDVILDLHWSDGPGDKPDGGQQVMPDKKSVDFWRDVATMFKADDRVLFELYNEPHPDSALGYNQDSAWNVWQNGGMVGGFLAAGFQELITTVRATGAKNIVIVGGIDYAYSLKGVPTHPLTDATGNLVYATHPYDYSNKMPGTWDADWGFLAATKPILVTEFGRNPASNNCDASYSSQVIQYANGKGAGWVGWAWYVAKMPCAFPSLITDWNGTPTQHGQVVKTALAAFGGK
jgi:hypothetical protein